jgi:serine protease
LSGTSMAAPHIAGLAARIWQFKADHPAQATRDLLHTMARDLGLAGRDTTSGWGAPTF